MQAQARSAPSISRRTYGPAASSRGSPAREASKDRKGGSSSSGGTKRRTFGPSSASTSVDGELDGVGADGAAADAFSEGGVSIADASSVAIPRRPTSGTYMAVRRPSEDTSAGDGSPGLGGDAAVMVTSPLAATRTRRASSGAMAYIAARRPTLSGSSTLGVSDGDGGLVTGAGAGPGPGAGVSLPRPSIASSSGLGTTTTRKSSGSEDPLGDVVMRTSPLALARPRLSSATGGLGLSVVAGGGSSSGRRMSHAASEEGLELMLPGSPSASASSPLRRPSMSMGVPGAGAGEGRGSPASVVVE